MQRRACTPNFWPHATGSLVPDTEIDQPAGNRVAIARRQCVLLFGGSFDPVHNGHVELARRFMQTFNADLLRLIPAGNPWQKPALQANPVERSEMLRLAFADQAMPFVLDLQEIERRGPSYSIDTMQAIRTELGREASLILILGADQLVQLDSWQRWRELFDYVHLGVAARPGISLNPDQMSAEVAAQVAQRHASRAQILASAQGLIYLLPDLAIHISSTVIRASIRAATRETSQAASPAASRAANQATNQAVLRVGETAVPELPGAVLDYIQHHHLYQN